MGWQPVYPASMLGVLYDDDIVILATENTLYYGELDESGNLPELRWLAGLNVDETMYSIDTDKSNLYISVTGYGIYRGDIESKKITYEPVVPRDVQDFIIYNNYLYYEESDILYRSKEDGSKETVLSDEASGVFTVYEDGIYYYSLSKEAICRVDYDGENRTVILQAKNVTDMLAAGNILYYMQNGRIYRLDLNTEILMEEEGLADADENPGLLVFDGVLYYAQTDSGAVVSFSENTGQITTLYQGDEPIMDAVMGDRLFIVNSTGEYYSISLDGSEKKKMDFNYLSMADFCVE
jgi:hypothetical protein